MKTFSYFIESFNYTENLNIAGIVGNNRRYYIFKGMCRTPNYTDMPLAYMINMLTTYLISQRHAPTAISYIIQDKIKAAEESGLTAERRRNRDLLFFFSSKQLK